ncbi:MAG: branched-chain amino acid ABC transporter ATP-binding protein [Betaproteobacteria bacterium RIFCSPLOWO2_12_FULL_62_13b]|nr:MAG: branched-chain amino acid ABC transporter ATP-binding protein [Betaproteobacteria bacterium RIFCSPLOWO2_12_FULL_62_13b]
MIAALETRCLCKNFGALTVAEQIDFTLEAGARHALIGPNGAGKTTLVNMLMGGLSPSSGSILLGGADVTRKSQRERVKRGLARTFQINTLFRDLTVVDNVSLAIAERHGVGWAMLRPASRYRVVLDEAMQVLESLGLAADAKQPLRAMPYGKQRLVEIAIALGMRPKVLLLDEPAAGIPSLETHRILEVLDALPAEIAILIIEHDMDLVFRFARRITVLAQGAVLMEGAPAEVSADERVRQVYLGERHG